MSTVDCHDADVAMVNMHTGEVMEELHGDIHATDEPPKQKQERFNEGEPFVKMFSKIAYLLGLVLSPIEFKVAYSLAFFVEYQSSILVDKNKRGDEKYLTMQDIADLLGMNYKTTARIIKSLCNKGVMHVANIGNCKGKPHSKYILMNPFIYINGKVLTDDTIVTLFQNSGWKELFNDFPEHGTEMNIDDID